MIDHGRRSAMYALSGMGMGASSATLASRREPDRQSDRIDVRAHGAVGDGVTDDTDAIQAAIDHAIYRAAVRTVYLPEGRFRIRRPLHLGYGNEFTGVTLCGAGRRYHGEASFSGTSILATHHDAPAINVQGARGTAIRDLTVIGRNHEFLHSLDLMGAVQSIDATEIAAWRGPELKRNARSHSRYAAYAGIAVDAYAGRRPEVSYPDVRYPGWLKSAMQWGKATSSEVWLDNVEVCGFEIGLATHPSGSDGQGDFVRMVNCAFNENVYHLSICQSQSRLVCAWGTVFRACHTAITNNTHGAQKGCIGGIFDGCNFEVLVRIVKLSSSYSGPVTFQNCYGEQVYQLGSFGAFVAGNHPITFNDCQMILAGHSASARGIPAVIAEGGEGSYVRYNRGSLLLPGICLADVALEFDGTRINVDEYAGDTVAKRKAMMVSMGILVPFNRLHSRPQYILHQAAYANVASAATSSMEMGRYFRPANGRDSPIPWSVQAIQSVHSLAAQLYTAVPPAGAPCTNYPKADCAFRLNAAGAGTIQLPETVLPACAGDILWDQTSNTIWRVDAVSIDARPRACICTVVALNNLKEGMLRQPVAADQDYLYLLRSGMYLPRLPVTGTVEQGASIVTDLDRGDASAADLDVAAGDYWFEPRGSLGIDGAPRRVTALDAGAARLTLSSKASVTLSRQPLGYFLRTDR